MSALLVGIVLLSAPATAERPSAETPAAREQARLCEELTGDESIAACHNALALGLGPKRAASVHQLLASRLASRDRWEELAQHYQNIVRLHPKDGEAQLRLGAALLLAVDRAEEALGPLREVARLEPDEPRAHLLQGVALNALGRHDEAVAAFQEALRLDPTALELRPAARAAFEASQRQERWP